MSRRPDLGLKPRLGYAENPLERVSDRRGDAAFLASLEADPSARAYVVIGERVALKKATPIPDPQFTLSEIRTLAGTEELVLLGLSRGAPRFAVGVNPAQASALEQRSDLVLVDLRTMAVQGLAGIGHLGTLAQAKALLLWHARHRFCAVCGAATRMVDAGWRRDCPVCEAVHFPRTDPVAIMLAVDGDRCLLGRQARFPAGTWSCLAGFIEPGETIEDAVRREIHEEAGIVCGPVSYMASQPWPFPMSLMIGCHAQALSTAIAVDRTELEDARWFDREEVVSMLLRQHPQGLLTPPPIAIAYHIIRAWVEDEAVLPRQEARQ